MKAPFPWFGGKSRVASEVWSALGDCDHYCEPFFGSGAVLLGRPNWHQGITETINDADSYVTNFWRALQRDPDSVAYHADQPVNETDLFAVHLWLVNEGKAQMLKGLESDPDWFDPQIAGRWVWGLCAWIGSGWCSGTGPHTYETIGNGSLAVGNAGQGVNRKRPHLGNAGQGVNRQRPHLGNAGQGVNRQRPSLNSREKNSGLLIYQQTDGDIYAYMRQLAARLRRVRVCCGDWSRVVTNGALAYGNTVGIFLDPPYSDAAERTSALYTVDDLDVAHAVREWAIANGDNPRYRIVLAGYESEHVAAMPAGWRMYAYRANKAYGSSNGGGLNDANRRKERLWYSPFCLQPQPDLFSLAEAL